MIRSQPDKGTPRSPPPFTKANNRSPRHPIDPPNATSLTQKALAGKAQPHKPGTLAKPTGPTGTTPEPIKSPGPKNSQARGRELPQAKIQTSHPKTQSQGQENPTPHIQIPTPSPSHHQKPKATKQNPQLPEMQPLDQPHLASVEESLLSPATDALVTVLHATPSQPHCMPQPLHCENTPTWH